MHSLSNTLIFDPLSTQSLLETVEILVLPQDIQGDGYTNQICNGIHRALATRFGLFSLKNPSGDTKPGAQFKSKRNWSQKTLI